MENNSKKMHDWYARISRNDFQIIVSLHGQTLQTNDDGMIQHMCVFVVVIWCVLNTARLYATYVTDRCVKRVTEGERVHST